MGSVLRRLVLSCAVGVLAGTAARAQRPEPTLAQLAHRAWTARDGAPSGISTLAQTRDGFLWLGGTTGLFRFDGVRFERYEPPAGQAMPANNVNVLAALPDGALWVGYNSASGSVSAVSADGRLTSYGMRDGLPGGVVTALARDSAGTMWASTGRGLARLAGGRWTVVGPGHGYPGGFTNELTVDGRGALWVAGAGGVYVLPRGAQRFAWRAPPLAVGGNEVGSGSVRAGPDGSVWTVSLSRGLVRLTDTAGRLLPPAPYYDRDRGADRGWWIMAIDRHGHAWGVGTINRLVRVALPGAGTARGGAAVWDTLPLAPGAGASGRTVSAVFEDREGSIWVATEHGVDQFRLAKVTPLNWPGPYEAPGIAAAEGGALWAGGYHGVMLLSDRGRTRVRAAPPTDLSLVRRDLVGDAWFGGPPGVWQAHDGHLAPVALPPELHDVSLMAIARDRTGALWVSGRGRGVFRRRGGTWERYGAPGTNVYTLTADSAGRVWLAYGDGRLVREGEGSARVYGAADGLRVGAILTITIEGQRVWVGGELGVAVLDLRSPSGRDSGGARTRFVPLVPAEEPLRDVGGIVPGDDAVWLSDANGVVRVPAAEVARALRDPGYRVRAERFDARDRVDGGASSYPRPTAVRGTDGRVWFTWVGGLGWIDPAHVRRNPVPPPVQVRGLSAGGRVYPAAGMVRLPERTRALSVGYTALSLAVPERVRLRYRLVGLDTAWQDAGARREAFYTNLPPRAYRFEVTAANEDGVWSVAPATLDVVIPPAFVETNAFLALCAAAAGGAVWALAVWRQRQAVAAARARAEVASAERLRVARELHDTLLTDVAGLRMQLDAATRTAGPGGVAASLVAALRDQAGHALVNARRAVVEMRTSGDGAGPVADQVAEAARRTFAGTAVDARVAHTGRARRYAPAVEAEALRIAGEALANARAHADCRAVRVTCAYGRRALRLEVRDDGRGFDPARAAAEGHFGLVGMRERAAAIGARLTVESAPGRGTAVLLVVPVRDAD